MIIKLDQLETDLARLPTALNWDAWAIRALQCVQNRLPKIENFTAELSINQHRVSLDWRRQFEKTGNMLLDVHIEREAFTFSICWDITKKFRYWETRAPLGYGDGLAHEVFVRLRQAWRMYIKP